MTGADRPQSRRRALTMPCVSVIIPAYRPPDFAALAASMAANAGVDANWIVVDDGSGPEYDAVFETLPAGVRRIRLPENRGQGAARNAGLTAAGTRWVAFLDADDRFGDGHLAALLAAAKEAPDGTLPFGSTRHVFSDGRGWTNTSWQGVPADPQVQLIRFLTRPFLPHCGALYPRAALTAAGGYDESLVTDEDGDLLIRLLQAGHVFQPVPEAAYLYGHGDGPRVSADDTQIKMQARIRVTEAALARAGPAPDPQLVTAVAQRLDKIALTYWSVYPEAARAVLMRAEALAPGYTPDGSKSQRILRRIGGPGLVFAARRAYRHLKGRPGGGMMG